MVCLARHIYRLRLSNASLSRFSLDVRIDKKLAIFLLRISNYFCVGIVCWKVLLVCYCQGSSYIISKMAYEINEQKKIGLGLIGFGIFFTFLGVILFFDRGLLALGNIFWLAGVALLLGWRSTLQLFTNRSNYKGSVSFLLGLFFIFVRWPIVGIILEIYGCIVLFGGFWPSVKVFCFQIPVFGWILQYPVLLLDRLRRSFG
uniref:Putative vesicle transport protein GOT1B isoform X1 n=1 Tax=Davidia involucrata TaxID=16924 RepID=A0A5B7BHU3_DAVIN